MKKAILLLVDSLMPDILEDCLRNRTVPAIRFLKDRGRYWDDCVTVFPTMTATVDSSLLTGVYPDIHRVPGIIWYDPKEKEIVNYLNGWRCAWKLGIYKCTRNVLYDLNEKHLSKRVATIFEELAHKGKTSASINAILHRGNSKHRLKLPFWINLVTGFQLQDEISGPDLMTLGAMVESRLGRIIPRRLQGIRHYLGINDTYAVKAIQSLVTSEKQPDFTLAYLPDNDHEVHKRNPDHARRALIRVDRRIQQILNAFGSWDEALNQCVFIVTGDHGQTRIGPDKEFTVDLDKLLESFRVLQLGEDVKDHDLVICNNERMAYLYPLKPEKQEKLLRQLLTEPRIDLIAWKKGGGVAVREGGSGREIYFEPGGPHVDVYGADWTITGEWGVLDLRQYGGKVKYGDYPDALSRLHGALYSQDAPVIAITARPRYEFLSRYYPKHVNGGCHGSLHKYDSFVPLLIAGTEHPIPTPPRLVDLKRFVVGLFK